MILEVSVTKPLLERCYDHPEHFYDTIREYRSSKRYVPTPLESLLFELAGHRCTICHAPWLEIHHIDELGESGETEYDNLIVLCPNCHTRVHLEGVPSQDELRHYKLKQEIAYELPIIGRLSQREKALIQNLAQQSPEDQITFSERFHRDVEAKDSEEAIAILKKEVGYFHLQEMGIVSLHLDLVVGLDDTDVSPGHQKWSVSLRIQPTSKGIKWVRYLRETGRVPTP